MIRTSHIGAKRCNSSYMSRFPITYGVSILLPSASACYDSYQSGRFANVETVVENIAPGEAFEVHETGWGEFEINIKLYYVPESQEKPQVLYHYLQIHPYGETDEQKETMRREPNVKSWKYEEQLFNEPYEHFYEILTSPIDMVKGAGKSTKTMRGGMVSGVGQRTATIPLTNRPGQPFSRETEKMEVRRLKEAKEKIERLKVELEKELKEKEREHASLAQYMNTKK